jgi:hypothetical protein
MKAYLKRHPDIYAFAVAVLMAVGVALGAHFFAGDVQAATTEAADFGCETIARANGIEVYYCEPDYGPTFIMNGYGFVVLED